MLRRRAALLHYGVGVGWGWGGAASYLDCSLDRGLLHRLTESAPMMSRKSSALLRCNLVFFCVEPHGVGCGGHCPCRSRRTSSSKGAQFEKKKHAAQRRAPLGFGGLAPKIGESFFRQRTGRRAYSYRAGGEKGVSNGRRLELETVRCTCDAGFKHQDTP